MGANTPYIERLTCEFCGNCHNLYEVHHINPVCSNFVVCKLHIDAAKEMMEVDA